MSSVLTKIKYLRSRVSRIEGRYIGDPPPWGQLQSAIKSVERLAGALGASDQFWMDIDEARADLRKNEHAAKSALLRAIGRLAKEERDERLGVPHHLRSSPKRSRASYGRKTSHCDACGKERTDVQPWGEIGACWLCRKEGQRRRIWSHREGRYVYASQGFPYYESDRARRRKKRRR